MRVSTATVTRPVDRLRLENPMTDPQLTSVARLAYFSRSGVPIGGLDQASRSGGVVS